MNVIILLKTLKLIHAKRGVFKIAKSIKSNIKVAFIHSCNLGLFPPLVLECLQ